MSRPLPLLLCLCLLSCGGPPAGSDEPVTFSVSSVSVDGLAPAAEYVPTLEGPLQATSVSPYGPASTERPIRSITATFSRPMVPLGDAEVPPRGSLRISPATDGTLSWNGSRTLVFQPSAPLPDATAFKVTISGLTALDGTELETPVSWEFETHRPRVARTAPERGDEHWPINLPLRVHFSQPMQLGNAAQFVRLFTDGDARVPARVSADGDSAVVLTPVSPLSRGAGYYLHIAAGIPSANGPLALAGDQRVSFSTLAPLRLAGLDQDRGWWEEPGSAFRPDRGVTLSFSTPVFRDSLARALSIEPEVEWLSSFLQEAEGMPPSQRHYLPGPWKSSTRYRVRVDSLHDAFGQVLSRAEVALNTGILPPSFSAPTGVMYLEPGLVDALPVRTTGIASVRASIRKMTPETLFPVLRAYDRDHWYGPLPEGEPEPEMTPAGQTISFPVEPGQRLATTMSLGADSLGVVAFRVDVAGPKGYQGQDTYAGVAVRTRLALTAKFSPHESLAAVTSIANARPLAGVEVQAWSADGRRLWTGTTGKDGTVSFPGWAALGIKPISEWDRPVLNLVARRGPDWTFISSALQDGIEPYRFNIPYSWSPEAEPTAGSVFSDRGLYRAGDTIHLKGVVRSRTSGDWKPLRDSVRVLVVDPRDEVVFNTVQVPGALGTFDLAWQAPSAATQGAYRVRVARASDEAALTRSPWERGDLTSGSFRVDAFRTATFSVETTTSAESYVAGDLFRGTITGRYLFGAEMRRAPAVISLTRRSGSFSPTGPDGFEFGPVWSTDHVYDTLIQTDTLLGENGTLQRVRGLPGSEVGAATSLLWEGAVQSPDGQEQSARSQITLHPALFYLGLKPSTSFLDLSQRDAMSVDVIAVTPAGAAAGDTPARVELLRRTWNSVREIGWDGRSRWRSESSEIPVAGQDIEIKKGKGARLNFRVPQAGSYVVRATATDVRGNRVLSESTIWVSGRGYVAWQREDSDMLELVADKESYRPGETARILIPSPFEEATALITVERDGVMQHEVRRIQGSAPQIDLPITSDHLPNVFVGVVLLTGRTSGPAAGGDVGAPAFRAGYVQLPVSSDSRHLRLEMSASADTLRPGQEVTVSFRVRDAAGKGTAAEIAFSAADAGVVDLIGYRLPDPFEAFYGPRSLSVSTSETRAHLVRQRSFGQKEEDLGGGGGDADFLLRKDFRASAHWEPRLTTGNDGRASITFRLPESLTTFRLMAAAVAQGNRFGAGSAQVVTTKPLVLQQALPRFARSGDAFEAGVLVTNRTRQAQSVQVTARAQGTVLAASPTTTASVKAGETVRVAFTGTAGETGTTTFTFQATMGAERDAFEITIPVLETLTRVRSGQFASTDGTVTDVIQVPASAAAGRSSLDVSASSTALVGLDGAVRYLFEYPYGCLEQRTSRIRPLVVAGAMLDAFDLDVLDGNRQTLVNEWMEELDRFWTGEGFSLWPGGTYVHPFVSAYVLLTLADAREAGMAVDPARIQRVATALEAQVRNASDRPDYLPRAAWSDSRALMLLALSRSGRYLETEVATLADLYLNDAAASVDGMSYLIQTMTAVGGLNARRDALLQRVRRLVRVEAEAAYVQAPSASGYAWIFASDTRASASALTALATTGTDRASAEALVRGLIRSRPAGHWSTTQDNAAVVDALAAYRRAFEKADPDFEATITLAGKQILKQTFRGPTLSTAATTITDLPGRADLTVRVDGTGRVFYSTLVETYVTTPPAAASNGLGISRSIQRLDRTGEPAGKVMASGDGLTATTGELLLVTVRLESPTDRNYIVVDDALPAGLEPVNTAFATTRSGIAELEGSDQWWGSFNHTELRNDRVLLFADYLRPGEHTYRYVVRAGAPGRYLWPGMQAEAMYSPTVHARGLVAHMEVVPGS